MERLDFVLWMCLYPIATSVECYLNALRRSVAGDDHFKGKDRWAYEVIIGITYIWIAIEIW